MKTVQVVLLMLLSTSLLVACKKESPVTGQPKSETGFVTGKVVNAKGASIAGAKIVIEHTVWQNTYVNTTTDNNGNYKIALPKDPAGSWTAKAQIKKSAYDQDYTFDLSPDSTNSFTGERAVARNFTWKLAGQRPGSDAFFGAHVDLYQFGADVQMDKVKLVFTPYPGESVLIDGSPAVAFERNVEDVAGTFMAKDVPIGKYTVKAVYQGKILLLDNRHDDGEPGEEKTVVFGKNGYLAETEYNIEFWLSE